MLKANAVIQIVAAENVYGNVAGELGGPYVSVINILNSPTQDPHLFTLTPAAAKAINKADIIIYNGADYDPWMRTALAIQGKKNRSVIPVAALIDAKADANPHLWYLPMTMPLFAKILVKTLIEMDPIHQAYYENQLNQFNQHYQIIFATIKRLRTQFQHTPVIATEPVFNNMADSIGLIVHGKKFQINVMNAIPPTISEIKSFEDDISQHKVKLLIYNTQTIDPTTEHMRQLAIKEHIPVMGVSELMPDKITFTQWMMKELNTLESALSNQHGNKKHG